MKNIFKFLFVTFLLNGTIGFATTFYVTSTGDNGGYDPSPNAGTGTLRQAIVDAIDAGGTNTINFTISGTGPHTITLLATLPAFSNLTINGFSQSGASANTSAAYSGNLNPTYKIIIKSGISGANTLLTLTSSNVIKGIVFEDCASAGTLITINGSSNTVEGCYVGMQSNGTSKGASNATYGIKINSGANTNTIGGTTAAAVNLISGLSNLGYGVHISGTNTNGNLIKGNIIGLQKNGTTQVSSSVQLYGVYITGTAYNNTVGGTGSTDGNIISGQYGQYSSGTKYYGVGVYINSTHSSGNKVYGNRIGTQYDGSTVVSSNKQYFGIRINNSPNNLIGDNSTYGGNVISGNGPIASLGLSQIWATGLLIEGSGSSGNIVKHNYIGCNAAGTGYVVSAEQYKGIRIKSAGTGNKIGGTAAGDGNVISGNTCNFGGSCGEGRGITIKNTSSVTIEGNIIGLNASGTGLLSNAPTEKQYWGIEIDSSSTNNIIGATKNVISGNSSTGIVINGSNCTGNVIKGNYIGLQIGGTAVVGSNIQGYGISITGGANNTIGGTGEGDRNIISGNLNSGIIMSSSASSNSVIANYIGTDKDGNKLSSNTQVYGVQITSGSSNTIGGSSTSNRNLISANETAGVLLNGSGATGNTIKGNYIGTNSAGTGLISSASQDIGIWTLSSASGNTIGGTGANDGNLISGNTSAGIQLNSNSNTIYGNTIGTTASQTNITSNTQYYGIFIDANSNIIGGGSSGQRNIISANTDAGIYIQGTSASNIIKGNYIGCNTSSATISNSNQDYGIYIISASGNTMGGTGTNEGNIIAFNTTGGVFIYGTSATANKITRNLVFSNTGKGVNLNYGAYAGNNNKTVPVIATYNPTYISGTSGAWNVIEIFKNTTGQGDAKIYVGTATANVNGFWSLSISLTMSDYVVVNATDGSNNTSEFTLPLLPCPVTPVSTSQSFAICIGCYQLLPDGDTTYVAGVFVDTIATIALGCDSIVTTTVTINPNHPLNLITWYSLGTVSANSVGTLQNTGNDSLWVNAYAIAEEIIDSVTSAVPEWMQFTIGDTVSTYMIGYSTSRTDTLKEQGNYMVMMDKREIVIIETDNDGFYSKIKIDLTININDVIRVEIKPDVGIVYTQNGTAFHTSTLPSDTAFSISANIYGSGNTITTVRKSPY